MPGLRREEVAVLAGVSTEWYTKLEKGHIAGVSEEFLAAIADAAVRGMGLAWLPFWLVRDVIEAGALEALLPQQPGFLYDVHATWLQSAQLPRKVRLAIDALIAAIPGLVMPAAE